MVCILRALHVHSTCHSTGSASTCIMLCSCSVIWWTSRLTLPSAKCTSLDTPQISSPNTHTQKHPSKVTPCTQEPHSVPLWHAWFLQCSSVGLFSCPTALGKRLIYIHLCKDNHHRSWPQMENFPLVCLIFSEDVFMTCSLQIICPMLLCACDDFSAQIILLVDLYHSKTQAVFFHSCSSLLFWSILVMQRPNLSPLSTIQLISETMPDVWFELCHQR